jgi:hypothetical protein
MNPAPLSPRDALADLWSTVGLAPAALERVSLTGADPVLPSSFALGTDPPRWT